MPSQPESRLENVIHADFAKPSVLRRFCERYDAGNLLEAINTSYKPADAFMKIREGLHLDKEDYDECVFAAIYKGISAPNMLIGGLGYFKSVLSPQGLEKALIAAVTVSSSVREYYLDHSYLFIHLECYRRVLEMAMVKHESYSEAKARDNRGQFRLVLGDNNEDNEGIKKEPPRLTVVK
jgi:hypothetical protein